MIFENKLISGLLIKRYKRFLVDIKINNQIITAHCPNTGSMHGLLNEGNKVWISKSDNSNRKFKYVFTTGGIGPTHDDITAESISKAFKVKYEFHKEAYSILEKYYGKKKFNDGRRKMAKMPSGAKLIYNPSSGAPGFIIKNVFSLPGVPSILNSMIDNCKKHLTKGSKIYSKTVNLFTVESHISKKLGAIQNKYKKHVEIGSYPFFRLGKIGVSIVSRSASRSYLKKVEKYLKNLAFKQEIKIFKI